MDKFPSRARTSAATIEPRVSAVVLVRGARRLGAQSPLELCLRSALAEPWIDELIVVVHGAPEEVYAAMRAQQLDRRDMKVIRAPADVSSAAAANLGARGAHGRWLLFLESDVVLRRGAVARMAAAAAAAPAPWIVGGRLTDTRGRHRAGALAGALGPLSAFAVAFNLPGSLVEKNRACAEPARVAAVSGAFMLAPRDDFQAMGGFDEAFLSDGADLDLCRRFNDAGGSVVFQPAASGVQVSKLSPKGRRQAQGLALFATKSAKTPLQKALVWIVPPLLTALLLLRDLVLGRPPAAK